LSPRGGVMTSGTASPFILAAAFIQACAISRKAFVSAAVFAFFSPAKGFFGRSPVFVGHMASHSPTPVAAPLPIMDNPSYAR
jgi:hypothetical protein